MVAVRRHFAGDDAAVFNEDAAAEIKEHGAIVFLDVGDARHFVRNQPVHPRLSVKKLHIIRVGAFSIGPVRD